MKRLDAFKKFELASIIALQIKGGNDYNNCRATCYGDMAVGCESGPDPEGMAQFDACMGSGYTWCDQYCGSGV